MPETPETPSDAAGTSADGTASASTAAASTAAAEANSTQAGWTAPAATTADAPTPAESAFTAAPADPAQTAVIPPVYSQPADATATSAQTKQKRPVGLLIGAVAIAAIVGGAAGAGVTAAVVSNSDNSQSSVASTPQNITVNNKDDVTTTTAVAAKAGPSVVTISVSASSEGGTGSGVILTSDGYVLTNTHVVTLDGASASGTIEVTAANGKLYKAKVVGIDPVVDLAVIKLTDASGLQPIEFGDSSKLNVGQKAIAIGAPLGLSNTVTDGIVSSLNRSIQIASSAVPDSSGDSSTPGDGSTPFNFWNFGQGGSGGGSGSGGSGSGGSGSAPAPTSEISLPVIQTDAPINPGNSGGALLDSDGKLIGINVAIASTGSTDASGQSGSIGVGFAIPANLAQRISNEIIKSGSGTHGLLGASVTTATSTNSSVVGAQIEQVTSGGGADKAGLKKGDVVTSFNGVPITDSTDLTAQVRSLAPDSSAKLTYVRGGDATTVSVTVGTLKV